MRSAVSVFPLQVLLLNAGQPKEYSVCLLIYLGFGEWFSNFDFHQSNACRILLKLGEIRLRQITAERGKGSKAKGKSTKLSAACSDLFYFYHLLFNRSKRDRNISCSPVELSFGNNINLFQMLVSI